MVADGLTAAAHPLPTDDGVPADLVARLARTAYVLIGEATHGTAEFYALRAEITRRLIVDHGFDAVAIEGDWPDAARVHRFVTGTGDGDSPDSALDAFVRFPRWMWRNTVVRDFVDWLGEYNANRPLQQRAGFYGLDLYSLYTSIDAVVTYLDTVDPDAAGRARERYACFGQTGVDAQRYGYATAAGLQEPCEDEVVDQLVDLQRRAVEYARRDGRLPHDAFFEAQQNARLVADAKRYYRAMFRGRVESWNLRDRHMADTLDALATHLRDQRGTGRVVVWAHNSHLGDARATELGRAGELNLGQLARERHAGHTTLVGATTYAGEVTAASDWDGPVERKRVRPALPGSYEDRLHALRVDRCWIDLSEDAARVELADSRLQRAIGVIYRPETERVSHYFRCLLPEQFDVLVHVDHTSALEPLDLTSGWEVGEAPDTYPWAV